MKTYTSKHGSTITRMSFKECGVKSPCSEVAQEQKEIKRLVESGMTEEEAKKTRKELLDWANS